MERLRGILTSKIASMRETIHNTEVRRSPQSPTGIVVAMEIKRTDPSKAFVFYAGGLKEVHNGKEGPLFETAEVPTAQIHQQNIKVNDYIGVSNWGTSIERIGTPEEVFERWGLDVRELIGWNPSEDSVTLISTSNNR